MTAMPDPPSMTRASPSHPGRPQVGLGGDECGAAVHPDVAAVEDCGDVDRLAGRAGRLGGDPVGPLDSPHLGAAVDHEPSQREQPHHGDRDEQGDGAVVSAGGTGRAGSAGERSGR